MQVWLIRHGMTQGNKERRYIGRTDESLLPEERNVLKEKRIQLENLLISFENKDVVLYSSPLKRCVETANLLFPGLPISVENGLCECNFGDFEYKNYQELKKEPFYQKWIDSNGTLPFPNGESQESFQKRCVDCFEYLLGKEYVQDKQLLIFVVHGGTIMSLMSWYAVPKRGYFEWQPANGCGFICELSCNKTKENRKEIRVCQNI